MAGAAGVLRLPLVLNACIHVVTHRVLSELVQNLPLRAPEALYPVGHELYHFPLDFGVSIVKFWVESERLT